MAHSIPPIHSITNPNLLAQLQNPKLLLFLLLLLLFLLLKKKKSKLQLQKKLLHLRLLLRPPCLLYPHHLLRLRLLRPCLCLLEQKKSKSQ
jgi:hypothetical protein